MSTRIAEDFIARLEAVPGALPRVHALHLPHPDARESKDGEFCALELEDGSIGLSYVLLDDTLTRLMAGQAQHHFQGADLLELIRVYRSPQATRRMLGFAAINAASQHLFSRAGYRAPDAPDSVGGLSLGPGERIGMIGLFPGLARRIADSGAELVVVERRAELLAEPAAGYRLSLDPRELAHCSQILSTTTLLLNETLDEMLGHCRHAQRIALVGPGGGCIPDPLFERGVTLLGGTRIEDHDGFVNAIRTGAAWGPFARKVAIERDTWRSLALV